MGKNNGLQHLVDHYRKAGGIALTAVDVHIHELLLLKGLWDYAQGHRRGRNGGHGLDCYARRVESLLNRAEKEQTKFIREDKLPVRVPTPKDQTKEKEKW
jgi:hypothetical protein